MIQVTHTGTHFTVLVDGVADGHFLTRSAAIRHAMVLREAADPIRL